MTPRIGLDLEPAALIIRALPDLDLLDIVYAAVHGGAHAVMVPARLFFESTDYTPWFFNRPALPLFAVKIETELLDRLPQLGDGPDRIVLVSEGNHALHDPFTAAESARRVAAEGQEIGALIEPEPSALKELSRARAHWAYFSTTKLLESATPTESQAELARLTSASLAATKLNLRVALWGPTGRHLPPSLASVPHVEEIYPAPDLWTWALRLGWERAVAEFSRLLR